MKAQIIDLEGTITTVHLQAFPVMEDAGEGSRTQRVSHMEGLPHGGSLTQSISYVVFCAVLLQQGSSTQCT